MFKNMRIGAKLITLFLLVGLIPLIVASVISVSQSQQAIRAQVEDQLEYVCSVKKGQVEEYFDRKMTEVSVLSKTADAVIAYRALNAYLEDWDIGPADPYDVSTSDYREIYDDKCRVFGEYMREYGYEDVYLIHGEFGHVMYSGSQGKDHGTNLAEGPYAASELANLWRDIRTEKLAKLTDASNYAPTNNKAAMFAGAPILDAKGSVISVVAVQIPLSQIDAILQNREGLGQTGASYLVGPDRKMRSNVTAEGPLTVLTQEVPDHTVADAFSGAHGVQIAEDFQGREALSAYNQVRVGSQKWAAVVEMDTDEVFAAIGSIRNIILILGFVLAALVVGVGSFTAKTISKPISQVVKLTEEVNAEFEQFAMVVDAIAENDLTQKIEDSKIKRIAASSNDELGQLVTAMGDTLSAKDSVGKSMQKMITNLNDMVRQIQGNASELASAAGEVSSSSERIASGSTDQSNRVDQVSAAIEEMAATITETSRNAAEAASASGNASTTASGGGEVVGETVSGMERINEVVQESARSLGHLADSAEQIGEIVTTINDIADQTNLLALNAAIEAARAGEQGRGFAVVADEVRKLAERTSKATGEIGGMIQTIQDGTDTAVKSMETGTGEVNTGRELAGKAGQSLAEIVEMSQKVMTMVEMIATASEEQSVAAGEIAKNVEGFSGTIKETASEVSVTAQAAGDLNRLADDLNKIVGRFQI